MHVMVYSTRLSTESGIGLSEVEFFKWDKKDGVHDENIGQKKPVST
jgi:hypothetical protein